MDEQLSCPHCGAMDCKPWLDYRLRSAMTNPDPTAVTKFIAAFDEWRTYGDGVADSQGGFGDVEAARDAIDEWRK